MPFIRVSQLSTNTLAYFAGINRIDTYLDVDEDGALSDGRNSVSDEVERDGGQEVLDLLRRKERHQKSELRSRLQTGF